MAGDLSEKGPPHITVLHIYFPQIFTQIGWMFEKWNFS